MNNIITVEKLNVARANWKITTIKAGKQVSAQETKGDAGQAAAVAINASANAGGCKIVAPANVMQIING